MELTQEIVTNDMHKIKGHLARLGFDDVIIEYPGFLSIAYEGREIHAGYYYDDDERADGEMFQVYDFTNGYQNDFIATFATNNDLQYVAGKLRRLILTNVKGN